MARFTVEVDNRPVKEYKRKRWAMKYAQRYAATFKSYDVLIPLIAVCKEQEGSRTVIWDNGIPKEMYSYQ